MARNSCVGVVSTSIFGGGPKGSVDEEGYGLETVDSYSWRTAPSGLLVDCLEDLMLGSNSSDSGFGEGVGGGGS